MPIPLTHKQQAIWDFIKQFHEEHSYAPILRQIAKAHDLSVGTVQYYVEALESKGRLKRTPGEARTIQLIEA